MAPLVRDPLGTRGRSRWSVAIEVGVWLAAACLLLAQTGCFDPGPFRLTKLTPGVNDKLRQEFEANDPADVPLRFFSDGSPESLQGKLLSTFVFPSVQPGFLSSLRLSETFWLEAKRSAALSYEAVAHYGEVVNVDDSLDVYKAYDLGSCEVDRPEDAPPRILAHDFHTRGQARIVGPDGNQTSKKIGLSALWDEKTLPLWGFTEGGANDPKNPPGEVNVLTAVKADIPRPQELPSPACLQKYQLKIDSDTTYRLHFVNTGPVASAVDCSRLNSPGDCSHTLYPTVKLVNESRRLARPLTREGQSSVWSWGVDTTSAALWKENFSPHLHVESVAIFTDDPSGPNGRRYWTPEHVDVAWDRGQAMTSVRCNDQMTVDENGVQVQKLLIPDCSAGGFTPTYKRTDLGRPIDDNQALLWRVKVQGQNDQPPDLGGAVLYIEFDVVQNCYPDKNACFGMSQGSLLGVPASTDLGDVRTGRRTPFERVFRLQSVGAGSVRVVGARLEGPNANEFSVRTASGRPFPMVLPFGTSIELSLDANVQSVGDKRPEVVVDFNAMSAAQPERIRLPVAARGVAPDILVLPPILHFLQSDVPPSPSSGHFRQFMTINQGSLAAQRQRMRVTGPHASYFWIVSSDYYSAVSTPPSATQTIGPGQSESGLVAYRPQMPGDHEAVLEIPTDAGTYTIRLNGTCYGACRYDVPAMWNAPDIGVLVLGDARSGGLGADLKVTVDQLTPGLAGALVSLQGTDQVSTVGGPQLCRCLEDVELNRELLSAEAWQRLETLRILKKEQTGLSGGRLQVCYRLTPLGERVTKALKATSSYRSR